MSSTPSDWLQKVIRVLCDRGIASSASIIGCTDREIAEIAQQRTLPLRYREFLRAMGRGAGTFYVGSTIFYPSIIGLSDEARSLVAEDPAGIVFPEDAFAFSMHQGYEVLFFRTTEGDDPPVYYYMEISGVFRQVDRCFTEFLLYAAND